MGLIDDARHEIRQPINLAASVATLVNSGLLVVGFLSNWKFPGFLEHTPSLPIGILVLMLLEILLAVGFGRAATHLAAAAGPPSRRTNR